MFQRSICDVPFPFDIVPKFFQLTPWIQCVSPTYNSDRSNLRILSIIALATVRHAGLSPRQQRRLFGVLGSNLIEELSAVCHNCRSGSRPTRALSPPARRTRVLNLRIGRSGLKPGAMIGVFRITIWSNASGG